MLRPHGNIIRREVPLLVSSNRAMRRPRTVKRATIGFTLFCLMRFVQEAVQHYLTVIFLTSIMYDQSLEHLIDAVIEDGVITDQERKVVYKKAASLGIDQDEIEVYLEGRLQKAQKSAAPKSGKHGVVKTCPNCGAPVVAGMAKCPDCGFAYIGIDVTNSAKLLDERLRAIKGTGDSSDEKRANIIRSFPIPNSREDLVEFLSTLEPKALTNKAGDTDSQKAITKAYREKFVECLNKMRLSFPDDSATKMFEQRFTSHKKKNKAKWTVLITIFVIVIGAIVAGIIKYNHDQAAEKAALQEEYDNWKSAALIEINQYAEELDAKLNQIPTPTVSNWEKCGRMWNQVSWTKSWQPEKKFYDKDICDYDEYHKGIDGNMFEAFVKKKNNIGEQIKEAQKRALINQGFTRSEANGQTYSSFHDSPFRHF